MIPPVYNESLSAGLLSLTPHLHRRSSSGQWLLAPRELHPSEDLSELPHLLRRITAETASTLDFMAGQEYLSHRRSWLRTVPPCA